MFAAPEKVAVLADALLRAVARGRDNELFVLLADLLELDNALDPLLRRAGGPEPAPSSSAHLSLAGGRALAARQPRPPGDG